MSETTVIKNISQLLTMDGHSEADPGVAERPLGMVRDAAVVMEGDRFAWAGRAAELPELSVDFDVIDAGGRVAMPGLVECHTHLVFGGGRAEEFELRARGVGYEEIARRGGGILSTVEATRAASRDELRASALPRLDRFLKMGVPTLEAKSGYGLETKAELKLLEVIAALDGDHVIDLVPTFLGAHVVAPEYRDDRSGYLDLICKEMLPEVASRGLANFCDVFCEDGAFTVDESRTILETASGLGLGLKLHAEQLGRTGGAGLAAEVGAISADHLDFATEADAAAMALSGVTAVFLPGATFFIGKKRFPPGRVFARAGATLAVSTDFNPGSSYTANLWLMGTMCCTYLGLSPAEALRAMTAGAAAAVGLEHCAGAVAPGFKADLLLLEDTDWQTILYLYGRNPVAQVYKAGKLVAGDEAPTMN